MLFVRDFVYYFGDILSIVNPRGRLLLYKDMKIIMLNTTMVTVRHT